MKKILISGGDSSLAKELINKNESYKIISLNKKKLNILKINSILINLKKSKPNYFIHTAALSAPMTQHEHDIKKSIELLSKDSEGEKRIDRLSTITTRLYLHLTSPNYKILNSHSENLIQFFLLEYLPKDLSMSLYMDLLKFSNEKIKKMLRDKRLASFLVDAM